MNRKRRSRIAYLSLLSRNPIARHLWDKDGNRKRKFRQHGNGKLPAGKHRSAFCFREYNHQGAGSIGRFRFHQ
jgi:hypothetical protein